jgi:imidazolonepropionase
MRKLVVAQRLVTCDAERDGDLGVVEDGAVLIVDGVVEEVGEATAFGGVEAERVEAKLVTPGLVDAHTHAAWVGSRGTEYAMRMRGADYEEIAKAGGGIVASTRATRAASADEIADVLAARLSRMAAMGVTTVEVKSGYGLSEEAERRQLEAARRAAARRDLPRVVATFLGMHAVPPEAESRDAYASSCASWIEGIVSDGLAQYIDAYVDRSAFSVEQARPVLERGRELGLGVRVHVGQFADVGGAEMAADLGAASVDHLEHVSRAGADRLAAAGVPAVLLPVASFTLGQAPPDVTMLREAGVELVVASDANPGTAPTESLPLAMALAVRSYGLTVAETLLGVTRRAAASLGSDGGILRKGAPADLVLWDLEHEDELVQPWGVPRTQLVLRGGRALRSSE